MLSGVARDGGSDESELVSALNAKVVRVTFAGGAGVLAKEQAGFYAKAFEAWGSSIAWTTLQGDAIAPPAPDGPEDALDLWLAQALRFHGPVAQSSLARALPLSGGLLAEVLGELLETQTLVAGQLREGATELEVCDAENFETLLRILRSAARPEFEARPAVELPLFMAHHQHLAERGEGEEGVRRALEPLLGYAMPAAMWETEVLPARVNEYRRGVLDSAIQETDLRWVGAGEKQTLFFPESQLDLVRADGCEAEDGARTGALFPGAVGKFGFGDLLKHAGMSSADLAKELWRLAWRGCITNDSMETLRAGITTHFRPPALPTIAEGSRRRGFRAWKSTRPLQGHWYRLPDPQPSRDLLEEEDVQRERVRLLLDRYGIVFRELLQQEVPLLRWPALFRTMRLMELSGELLAGHFFDGVPGLQFISPAAFEELQRGLDEDVVYMLNATDPASLCGMAVEGSKERLPSRVASTHVVFRGTEIVVLTRKTGKEWEIRVRPDDAELPRYLEPMHRMLTRDVDPRPSFGVETINGEAATRSAYLPALRHVFDVSVDPRRVTLWKKT